MSYKINIDTNELVREDRSLGVSFYRLPWREATLDEINSYLLAEAIDTKKAEINTQRDEALLTDITIGLQNGDNVELQVSKDIFFVLQSMISAELNDIGWVLKDNSIVEFKQADFITFRDNLLLRNDEIIQARKRKDFIMTLRNAEEVEAYDITTVH